MDGLQFFDRRQSYVIASTALPHWSQAGTVCFITWRTADSLPKSAREELARKRIEILRTWGIDDDRESTERILGENSPRGQFSPRIARQLAKLSPRDRAKLHWLLFEAQDSLLDAGAGACVLAWPELSAIVADALEHFDGSRYVLTDYVVMPNHVHVLAALADEDLLRSQVTSWKRYSARLINAELRRRGDFWLFDQFHHLVRSPDEFGKLRRYIADNPRKAGLAPGTYRHYSKPL